MYEDNNPSALEIVPTSSLESITRGESSQAVDTAKRYPRTISRFKQAALSLATVDEDTAGQCFYHLPRGDGIFGPSVRLAEIVASTWGNMRVAARVVEVGAAHVTAQGAAWDLETNYHVTSEVKRSILKKNGDRYNADMINVTSNAACSTARRNATFAAVPRAYWQAIYEQCMSVAVGDSRTLTENVRKWFEWTHRAGISDDRVLAALGVEDSSDIGLHQLKVLQGKATAVQDNEQTIDAAFPEPVAEADDGSEGKKTTTTSKRRKAGGRKKPEPAKKPDPKPSKAEAKAAQDAAEAAAKATAKAQQEQATAADEQQATDEPPPPSDADAPPAAKKPAPQAGGKGEGDLFDS